VQIFGRFLQGCEKRLLDSHGCSPARPNHYATARPEFFLECEMFQTEFVEKIKTCSLCSVNFSFRENCVCFYKIMWKNIIERGKPQIIIRRMRVAGWIR
jgi:hypothetical protein